MNSPYFRFHRNAKRLAKTTILLSLLLLGSCSSGSGSQSGLGLDLSGFWNGTLTERGTGRNAGSITLGLQSTINELTAVTTSPTISGSFTYNNALRRECPIGSIVGVLSGTVVGNNMVVAVEGDFGDASYQLTLSAETTSRQMVGNWSLHYEFKEEIETDVVTESEEGTSTSTSTEDVTRVCQLAGTWRALKQGA